MRSTASVTALLLFFLLDLTVERKGWLIFEPFPARPKSTQRIFLFPPLFTHSFNHYLHAGWQVDILS